MIFRIGRFDIIILYNLMDIFIFLYFVNFESSGLDHIKHMGTKEAVLPLWGYTRPNFAGGCAACECQTPPMSKEDKMTKWPHV